VLRSPSRPKDRCFFTLSFVNVNFQEPERSRIFRIPDSWNISTRCFFTLSFVNVNFQEPERSRIFRIPDSWNVSTESGTGTNNYMEAGIRKVYMTKRFRFRNYFMEANLRLSQDQVCFEFFLIFGNYSQNFQFWVFYHCKLSSNVSNFRIPGILTISFQ